MIHAKEILFILLISIFIALGVIAFNSFTGRVDYSAEATEAVIRLATDLAGAVTGTAGV